MTRDDTHLVLTAEQSAEGDRRAAPDADASYDLMRQAGRAVAAQVMKTTPPQPIAVLCGPGNNGGDGYGAAQLLQEAGWAVQVFALAPPRSRDAKRARKDFSGDVAPLQSVFKDINHASRSASIAIDALFGAGLDRPLDPLIGQALAHFAQIIAVDLPSGLHADTGAVLGTVIPARDTVTFWRKKPAHLLYPARALCGDITLADIGHPPGLAGDLGADLYEIVRPRLTPPTWQDHKYSRGQVVVFGRTEMLGASLLCAQAARRCGAGMVIVCLPREAHAPLLSHAPGLVARPDTDWPELCRDTRTTAAVVGPGCPADGITLDAALQALDAPCTILDAGALTALAQADRRPMLDSRCILTPHEGEFARLCPELPTDEPRLTRARAASQAWGGVVLLKGADTIIASPNGVTAISGVSSPWLATAGSGDVLAGMIAGLVVSAGGLFAAAQAAVWLHNQAAQRFGAGLIAEDVLDQLPPLLSGCLTKGGRWNE
ncbi:MAG: NAD(P)H-hydrate dehydratase [Pseudomonadota bacterium]